MRKSVVLIFAQYRANSGFARKYAKSSTPVNIVDDLEQMSMFVKCVLTTQGSH